MRNNKGQFVKGYIPKTAFKKGHSAPSTAFKKGVVPITAFKKGHKTWNKGKKGIYKHTEEIRKKISKTCKRKGIGKWMLGRKLSKKTKEKIAKSNKGNKHYNWQGGITILAKRIKRCFKYRQWKSDIFTKDNFICQRCNKRGGYLEAHHIKKFYKIIKENKIKTVDEAINCEELWNVNNGITYCKNCHLYKIHKWKGGEKRK